MENDIFKNYTRQCKYARVELTEWAEKLIRVVSLNDVWQEHRQFIINILYSAHTSGSVFHSLAVQVYTGLLFLYQSYSISPAFLPFSLFFQPFPSLLHQMFIRIHTFFSSTFLQSSTTRISIDYIQIFFYIEQTFSRDQ